MSVLPDKVSHGGTYAGNRVAAAAAVKTLQILRDTNALETVGKWIELLKETVPTISRLAVVRDPSSASVRARTSRPAAGPRYTSTWNTHPASRKSLHQVGSDPGPSTHACPTSRWRSRSSRASVLAKCGLRWATWKPAGRRTKPRPSAAGFRGEDSSHTYTRAPACGKSRILVSSHHCPHVR